MKMLTPDFAALNPGYGCGGCLKSADLSAVIAGLDPAIHGEHQLKTAARSFSLRRCMDARVKPGHDDEFEAGPMTKLATLRRK